MAIGIEEIQKGSQIYFELLKKKVIEATHPYFQDYMDSPDVQDVIRELADNSGTSILLTHTRIHLIANKDSEIFATNLTHLKSKYSAVENKRSWNLLTMIMMTYLVNIEETSVYSRTDHDGITYHYLESLVTQTLTNWMNAHKEDDSYPRKYAISMSEIIEFWFNLEVNDENRKKNEPIRGNHKSRIGYIHIALSVLKEEGLVFIADKDSVPRAIPTMLLFERLDGMYQDDARFNEIKEIIETQKENLYA